MKGSHSRLLQVVIAAMLINVAPDGHAETYDLQPVLGTYPDDYWGADEDYFDADYNNWEFNDYYEPSDAGDNDPDESQCNAIAEKAPRSCDLSNPPLMETNGCGSGGSAYLIPDYLSVYGVPVVALGPIFQGACNMHDVCYGTYPGDQESCDLSLNTSMINQARLAMTFRQWTFYGPFVKLQALGYSAGLQAPFIRSLSGEAFATAQSEGACRYYAGRAAKEGCLK